MENARLLDERLRRIIREIGGRTGGEIKKGLIGDLGDCVRVALEKHSEREAVRFLTLLKKAIDKI